MDDEVELGTSLIVLVREIEELTRGYWPPHGIEVLKERLARDLPTLREGIRTLQEERADLHAAIYGPQGYGQWVREGSALIQDLLRLWREGGEDERIFEWLDDNAMRLDELFNPGAVED